ncbi:MAG: response regulator [Planctomycetes bacterium]|nr:response regulator [Planctomycetota bacterium]
MAYVMVIDDDEDFASATAQVLRDGGHEVQIQLDTQSAVESMEKRRPDLAILDVMFPDNSSGGFDLARTIQNYNEKLTGIPILMLTAVNAETPLHFSTRDIDEIWLPVTGFLEKPVDAEVLLNKVNELLGEAKSRGDAPAKQARG